MRRFLILATSIILLISIVGFSFQIALAAARPVRPGHPVFPFQDFAEQARAQIVFGELDIANYYLDLAFQRTEDLVVLRESEHALVAMDYLDRALDRAIAAISQAPEKDLPFLESQLRALVLNIEVALEGFSNVSPEQLKGIETLEAKIATLAAMLNSFPDVEQIALNSNGEPDSERSIDGEKSPVGSEVPPHDVVFPPGSPGVVHEFFLLEGQHAELDCFACHSDGQYAGTPNLCVDCHSEVAPIPHFGEECAACHTSVSWQEVNFDHGLVDRTECKSCHQGDAPENHYTAQCSACHEITIWDQVDFNHEVVDKNDCQFCHGSDKPANHFTRQCSACHNTSSWLDVNFNHQVIDATDCKACHNSNKPANHYGGQCSACHNTTNWSEANFNHQAVGANDCKACHSGRKPANHYGGQCSACHNTSNWSEIDFNHQAVGATDCKACHSATKPANHFDGQCSQCHSASSWGGASFNHSFPMNHGGANGNCSTCHPSGGVKYSCYGCHDKGKTITKHNEEGISNLDSRCLDCHLGGESSDHESDHEESQESGHEGDHENDHEEEHDD